MYTTENKNSFSFKNVILQFLFVALFIFIMIWLFPLKSDIKKLESNLESTQTDFSVLYDRIFNENVIAMKDAAKSYYTTPRLPKNVGDKVKMTLGEMLDKKIILPFTDKNGDACDEDGSYVEITKYNDEYVMKVNLKCGEQENYLLVYMGCYDYCSTTICEKNTSDIKAPVLYQPTQNQTTQGTQNIIINNNNNNINNNDNNTTIVIEVPTPTPEPTPEPDIPEYILEYEYVKTESSSTESDWSAWSTTKVDATATRLVKYRVVQVKKLVGYNQKTTYTDDYSKPIMGTVTAVVGQTTKTYCTSYDYVQTGEVAYSDWTLVGTAKFTTAPVSTATTKYEKVGDYNWYCTDNCTSGTVMLYKVYTRTPANVATYKCTNTNTVTTAVTAQKTVVTGYEQKSVITKEPVYDYSNRTEYSYKDVSTTTKKTYKWSTYNDLTLLNDGYTYTGNTKTILK